MTGSGFDPGRLARLEPFLRERYLDTGKLPHAQLLIARDGEIVHFSSQGRAREASNRAIDERSIFRIPVATVGISGPIDSARASRMALKCPMELCARWRGRSLWERRKSR